MNYELIIDAVASYLIWAKIFFWKYKNKFDVWLIPDWHHIYTGSLKAAGYRLLKPNKNLILIWEWAVNKKICVLNKKLDVFMWKSWSINKNIISVLEKNKSVEFIDYKFDRIDSELPFFRLISDYENVLFMEIWDDLPKTSLINLLSRLSKDSNLMFISDFHRDKPMDMCKKMDNNILKLEFVKNDNNLYIVEIFLRLAKKNVKKPNLLAYLNTWDISTDKDITNWFWCVFL